MVFVISQCLVGVAASLASVCLGGGVNITNPSQVGHVFKHLPIQIIRILENSKVNKWVDDTSQQQHLSVLNIRKP